MKLVFFSVNNSADITLEDFQPLTDKEHIEELLSQLKPEEFMEYDLDTTNGVNCFVDDYNAEYLDGGWWVISYKNNDYDDGTKNARTRR